MAASACIFTSLIGWAGIPPNKYSFLVWYTVLHSFLTWMCFALLVIPGYLTSGYKHTTSKVKSTLNGPVHSTQMLDWTSKTNWTVVVISSKQASVKCVMLELSFQDVKVYSGLWEEVVGAWFKIIFSMVWSNFWLWWPGMHCCVQIISHSIRLLYAMLPEAYQLDMNTTAVTNFKMVSADSE